MGTRNFQAVAIVSTVESSNGRTSPVEATKKERSMIALFFFTLHQERLSGVRYNIKEHTPSYLLRAVGSSKTVSVKAIIFSAGVLSGSTPSNVPDVPKSRGS